LDIAALHHFTAGQLQGRF